MYTARSIDFATLENFYTSFQEPKTFLQSSGFAQYRTTCGEQVLVEGYFYQENLIGVAVIQTLKTRLKRWFHVPHGPLVLAPHKTNFWPWWLQHYQTLGVTQKQDLVRVASLLEPSEAQILQRLKFKPAAIHLVNPETTWILDITANEETLLANMKKSTRYEVRKSIKPETGFRITVDQNLDAFWELHQATVKRHGFVPFTRQSTKTELEVFGSECQIVTVWHDQKPLASGVFLFDDKAGYYHQGASVPSKLPAAHASLWAAICEAKKRGCTHFNFWGVSPEDQPHHPWFGLSKFKRGFGGFEKEYLHVHDFEITWKAKLNRIIEARRKKKREY